MNNQNPLQYIYKAKTVKSHPDIFGGTPNKHCSDLGGVPLQAGREHCSLPISEQCLLVNAVYWTLFGAPNTVHWT